MITREQIRKLAGYSYSRGVDIWRQGKIRRFQIKTTKKGRQIQADVKGSGRNLYDVRILLDEEEDSVQEAWCDCPAFYSYEGLCKHCTAVLLYYLENPDRVEEEHMSLPEFLKQRGLEGFQKEIGEAADGIKIQENRRFFHFCKRSGVHKPFRIGIQRRMHRHDVRLREQRIKIYSLVSRLIVFSGGGIVEHPAPEHARNVRHSSADRAKTDDAPCLPAQLMKHIVKMCKGNIPHIFF